MTKSGDRVNQVLQGGQMTPEKAESLLVMLVNMKHPNEWGMDLIPEKKYLDWIKRAREVTEKYWPDLWSTLDAQLDFRAESSLFKIREYLRRFWRTSDPHEQDWYIHRAREYYHRLRVACARDVSDQSRGLSLADARRELKEADTPEAVREAASWLNIAFEDALDTPPARESPFEQALFHLQEIARIPSRRPLVCPNPHCKNNPYFISKKKSQKFCSNTCARPTALASKRNYAQNKRRQK